MNRALALAARGRGSVEPNPMVGAVVVRDGLIVGEGYHERYGEAHAEVNALRHAGKSAQDSTLYVTLEPCCHFGKTPPCTESVIRAGVRRVVAAMLDPFPQVAGQGASRLREAGITFEVGVGELAARQLNAPYLKRLRGKSWVIAKWAMTLDGKIATVTGDSQWITSEAARMKVHQIRGQMDAIIIGRGTLLADDPLLTARPKGPRTPVRVVMTTTAHGMDRDFRLLQSIQEGPVFVVAPVAVHSQLIRWQQAGAELLPYTTIDALLETLAGRKLTNVMLEGGGNLIGHFLAAKAIDEVHAYVAPKIVGGESAIGPVGGAGIAVLGQALQLQQTTIEQLGPDWLIRGQTS